MRVLVACEFSGTVRDAFLAVGAEAISCDLLPSEKPGPHHQGNVLEILDQGFDLMIAHPPCTYLATAANSYESAERQERRTEAVAFVNALIRAPIARIAIENPVSRLASIIGPPAQIIQPWWFGHGEIKTTCLWLKGLWPLQATNRVQGRVKMTKAARGPHGDRWKVRSRTYPGVAAAMAAQWHEAADAPVGWLV